jgi:hypothetical protein
MPMPSLNAVTTRILPRLSFLAIIGYCLAFGWRGIYAHFSADDPQNMSWAWRDGFWLVIWHNITFWSTAYRPMGQIYYLSIFKIFGMNPLPYRAGLISIAVINACLSARLGTLLSGSRVVGLLTGLLAGARASMAELYFQNDIVYDALAYFFSMLTLIRYVSIRKMGEVPQWRQSGLIAVLYVAALDSKEISITVAGFVLAYEVLFHQPSGIREWWKREGRLPLLLLLIGGVYMAGKLLGPDSLKNVGDYKLHLSLRTYLENTRAQWKDLFYLDSFSSSELVVGVAILLLVLLFFRKSPALRWCSFYILAANLPIAFIRLRIGVQLYLPWFGWALMLAIVSTEFIGIVSRAAARSDPELPADQVRLMSLLLWIGAIAFQNQQAWLGQPALVLKSQDQTSWVISQIQALPFHPPPGGSVLFLEDPLVDWATAEISQLVWNDHSVSILLARQIPQAAVSDLIKRNASLLTFEDGRLRVVRQ